MGDFKETRWERKREEESVYEGGYFPSFYVESLCFAIHCILAHACLVHKHRGGESSGCRGLGSAGRPVVDPKKMESELVAAGEVPGALPRCL